MPQQEAVKYKEVCQKILNTTMQEIRKFNEMADQLLHEQLYQTNNYKELCAHMLRLDNALLKEIGEILDQESKDLVLDRKAKPGEEARSWKEECAKANIKLKATTMELDNVKGKLKHVIDAMEVYKQSIEQLVIEIEKEKQGVQQSVIQMEKEKQWILREKDKNR
jgi:hypothetical protein